MLHQELHKTLFIRGCFQRCWGDDAEESTLTPMCEAGTPAHQFFFSLCKSSIYIFLCYVLGPVHLQGYSLYCALGLLPVVLEGPANAWSTIQCPCGDRDQVRIFLMQSLHCSPLGDLWALSRSWYMQRRLSFTVYEGKEECCFRELSRSVCASWCCSFQVGMGMWDLGH